MMFRTLDPLGDWSFGNGIGSFSSDFPALKLNLLTRLRQWKGECFFDLLAGVDYNNFMDIGTKELLDADITRTILGSWGVIGILSFTSTLTTATRALRVEATISTVYGNLTVSEVI